MLFPFKNRQQLEESEELDLLRTQDEELYLEDNLAKQNFRENTKELFEPLTDTSKNTSGNLTKNFD